MPAGGGDRGDGWAPMNKAAFLSLFETRKNMNHHRVYTCNTTQRHIATGSVTARHTPKLVHTYRRLQTNAARPIYLMQMNLTCGDIRDAREGGSSS